MEPPVRNMCSSALVVSQGCDDIAQSAQRLVDLLALFQSLACSMTSLLHPLAAA